ncbi:MAG: YceD family protein [Verrucomicrobiales bacterium]
MTADPHPSSPGSDRLIIPLADLPIEGLDYAGALPASVFDLEPGGPRPLTPLRYRLHVVRDGERLRAQGEISADFSFDCVRCLESFSDRTTLDGYQVEENIPPKSPSVDLTDRIREDILLALPGHPRCEEGSLHPRVCPASKVFLQASDYSPEHPDDNSTPSHSRNVWGALDQLDLPAAPDPPVRPPRKR